MIVYRLSSRKYAHILSGEGAKRQTSNRWNSFGTPMLYTAESTALAALELHQYLPPVMINLNLVLLEIEVPEVAPLIVEADFFDSEWTRRKRVSQALGDHFVNENKYLVMKVPSAWVYACFNYLINPLHPRFNQVKIKKTLDFSPQGHLFNP